VECEESDFKTIADRMQIISSIPKEGHLLLRVVGDPVAGFDLRPLTPNLEDAYMYFMETVGGERVDEDQEKEVVLN
ncbi:hypothetical protein MJD09_07585, partial [bacterium]|nr:hypothetical protein [bacterium]